VKQDRPYYCVYRTRNKKTKKYYPKFRYRFLDYDGKWKRRTGFVDKSATVRIAENAARIGFEIRSGIRPVPDKSDQERFRPIQEHVDQYYLWGEVQGGKAGGPWSEVHLYMLKSRLKWWINTLKFKNLDEITLSKVESGIQKLSKEGKAGKTLSNYGSVLKAFVLWCVERNLLDKNPLEGLGRFDTTVLDPRRAMQPQEIAKLLKYSPIERKVLYKFALISGFRAGELASLLVGDLDLENRHIKLRAQYAKNRKQATIPLPKEFVKELTEFIGNRPIEGKLFLNMHHGNQSKYFQQDLLAAGIERQSFGGKLDFHSLRTSSINLGFSCGLDLKTLQSLARHSSSSLTLDTYGRMDKDRMISGIEAVGGVIQKAEDELENEVLGATLVQQEEIKKVVGLESKSDQELMSIEGGKKPGFESLPVRHFNSNVNEVQNPSKSDNTRASRQSRDSKLKKAQGQAMSTPKQAQSYFRCNIASQSLSNNPCSQDCSRILTTLFGRKSYFSNSMSFPFHES